MEMEIKDVILARRNNVLMSIADHSNELEKAISADEFKAKHGSDQVFTSESLSRYVDDKLKGVDSKETQDEIVKGIEDEFSCLTPVSVKENGVVKKFYVKVQQ